MTYRDDLQAARMRRDALARELHQVRRRMDEYRELARQEQALEREIAQTARDIEQARARVELPLLASVRVASPCKERWSEMTGDDHVRFCGRCEKNVYDLSSLTASQAEALLRERGESMCVRFFRRSDGTILTSDCPVGARRRRVWRRVAGAAVAGGLAVSGIALSSATIGTQEAYELQPATMDEEVEGMEWQGRLNDGYVTGSGMTGDAVMAERKARAEQRSRLREEARHLGNQRQEVSQRRIEISEACRKNPLDC